MSQKVWLMIFSSIALLLISAFMCVAFWDTDNFVYAGCFFVFGMAIALNLKDDIRTCKRCSFRFLISEREVENKESLNVLCQECSNRPTPLPPTIQSKPKQPFLICIGRIPSSQGTMSVNLELVDELETGSFRLDKMPMQVSYRSEDFSITDSSPNGRRSIQDIPLSDTCSCPDFINLLIENPDQRDAEFGRDLEREGWWRRTISNRYSGEAFNTVVYIDNKWTVRVSPEHRQVEFIKESYSDT